MKISQQRNNIYCWPKSSRLVLSYLYSTCQKGYFGRKNSCRTVFRGDFVSKLNGNYVAAAFVRAAPGMSRKLMRMNKNEWRKNLGQTPKMHAFFQLQAKTFQLVLPYLHSMHPHGFFEYLFYKNVRDKGNMFEYWTKRSSIVSWKQQSTCP